MKITNPFVNAKISINSNGDVEIKLICNAHASVPIELNDKCFIMDDLEKLLKAKYLSVYPKIEEKDE